jgi:uncharacterized protein (DUF488 family)
MNDINDMRDMNAMDDRNELLTVGHSNHVVERFIELLGMHGVTAVGDVRSSPYSRFNPQYNRENLRKTLKEHQIAYVFLGAELGPRSDDPACYVDGKVQYGRLAGAEIFKHGIRRLLTGMKTYRIALMCAEKDPITCHRMILVCRALRSEPFRINHILEDGSLESLRDSERRLIHALKMPQLRLFEGVEDLIRRAYNVQSDRIAYVRDDEVHQEAEEGP